MNFAFLSTTPIRLIEGEKFNVYEKISGLRQATAKVPKQSIWKKLWSKLTHKKIDSTMFESQITYTDNSEFRSLQREYDNFFRTNLRTGETIYYVIVGYTSSGRPLVDPLFLKSFREIGNHIWKNSFAYGCYICGKRYCLGRSISAPQNKAIIYRINKDGKELSYSEICRRVKELTDEKSVAVVPRVEHGVCKVDTENETSEIFAYLAEGKSLLDNRHLREGIVVELPERPDYTISFCRNPELNLYDTEGDD